MAGADTVLYFLDMAVRTQLMREDAGWLARRSEIRHTLLLDDGP